MGTRSRTDILDKSGNIIVSLYRQMDGNPIRMGRDLREFLSKNRLAKQVAKHNTCPEYNGGMEDLAGELFIFLKKRTKHIFPAHPKTNTDYAYQYQIYFGANGLGGLHLWVRQWSKVPKSWHYLYSSNLTKAKARA